MADATAIIAGILTHDFDDHLLEIQEALDKAKGDGVVDVCWRVQLGDLTIDQTDKHGHGITIGAAIELIALGGTVGTVDPKVSERDRLMILLAHHMAEYAITAAEAGKRIGADKFDAIRMSEYVEHDVPKDGSEPEPPDG